MHIYIHLFCIHANLTLRLWQSWHCVSTDYDSRNPFSWINNKMITRNNKNEMSYGHESIMIQWLNEYDKTTLQIIVAKNIQLYGFRINIWGDCFLCPLSVVSEPAIRTTLGLISSPWYQAPILACLLCNQWCKESDSSATTATTQCWHLEALQRQSAYQCGASLDLFCHMNCLKEVRHCCDIAGFIWCNMVTLQPNWDWGSCVFFSGIWCISVSLPQAGQRWW